MSAQERGICLRGKSKSGFIHYGVQQLSLLPHRLPAPALIVGTADLPSPIHVGTAWYEWEARAMDNFRILKNGVEKTKCCT